MPPKAHPNPDLLGPGQVIAGRYRLDHLLGSGGFGLVYQATQLNLERPVAVKLLRPDQLGAALGLARFLREAEVAMSLSHPNTVRVHDFGQTGDQRLPFIVWELLRGQTLGEAIARSGPLSVERARRVAAQVLKSLMEAHGRGIVHRDIKPANLFLSDFEGEPDFVRVMDFGVAKPVGVDHRGEALTAHGEMVGTPSYMAPEQVRSRGVGPATDLYALGLVLAEMLSGQRVYPGRHKVQLCLAQASEAPPPLPEVALSSALAPVILRATRKPIRDRYRDAAEMLADLETIDPRAVPAASRETSKATPRPPAPQRPSPPLAAAGPGDTVAAADSADLGAGGPTSSSSLVWTAAMTSQGLEPGGADAPTPAPSAPRRRSRGWLLTLSALSLVAAAITAAWLLARANGPAPADHLETTTPPATAPPAPRPSPDPRAPRRAAASSLEHIPVVAGVAALTEEVVRQRLEPAGYDVTRNEVIQGGPGSFSLTFQQRYNAEARMGWVRLARFPDESSLRAPRPSRENPIALAREGLAVLSVVVQFGTTAQAEEMMTLVTLRAPEPR